MPGRRKKPNSGDGPGAGPQEAPDPNKPAKPVDEPVDDQTAAGGEEPIESEGSAEPEERPYDPRELPIEEVVRLLRLQMADKGCFHRARHAGQLRGNR